MKSRLATSLCVSLLAVVIAGARSLSQTNELGERFCWVAGSVHNPGQYGVSNASTVLDRVAKAGGSVLSNELSKVVLVRGKEVITVLLGEEGQSGTNTAVLPGDILIVRPALKRDSAFGDTWDSYQLSSPDGISSPEGLDKARRRAQSSPKF